MTTQDASYADDVMLEPGQDEVGDDDVPGYRLRHPRRQAPRRAATRARLPVFRDAAEEGRGRILAELTDTGEEAGYSMTYKPARFEEGWLRSSVRSFYDQELIVDVAAQVKGGKEANVYRCRAHPRAGVALLAAKVYRPRQFRNLSNDQMYREGRPVLTGEGRPAKATDQRIMRAIGKKTAFGVQVQHTSWLMYEYTTLERLHRAGGAVPRPFGSNENALLMGYQGDAARPAPTLQEVSLGRREAPRLFAEVMRNVELLLQHGLVHGDLSAYNVLYWEGKVTLIDFPQVTDVRTNRNAAFILQRDVRRICDYFARQGVRRDPIAIAEDLWQRYGVADYRELRGEESGFDEIEAVDEEVEEHAAV